MRGGNHMDNQLPELKVNMLGRGVSQNHRNR